MEDSYVKLVIAALLPALFAILMLLLDKKTPFGRLPRMARQAVFGIVFGGLAILGTEWGIPMNGAQINCRDAAVLVAGLMFGAPAGIIAGLIGGIERWIAVAWGVGTFTRVACSASTIIAGFYSAALRKYMFEDKKPGVLLSLCIGVVMEIFHLTMVFITNMATPEKAMAVVRACTVPMVIGNGVSVMVSAFLVSLLFRDPSAGRKGHGVRISQTIQRWLLGAVVLAFAITSFFVFRLQSEMADRQTESLLTNAQEEIAADVADASDRNLLDLCHMLMAETGDSTELDLSSLTKKYNITEINQINKFGYIFNSNVPEFIGFNINSGGEQSMAFLPLLRGQEAEYVQEYGPISYDTSIYRKYAGVSTNYGFIQVGYDAEAFHKDIATQVQGLTKNRHVGETGYILIANEQYEIVSAPAELDAEKLGGILSRYRLAEQNSVFEMTIDQVPCYCSYRTTEGFSIISVLPRDEALQMRNVALYVNTFMEILVFALLFGLIYLLIKKVVVNQIQKINDSLGRITGGHLDETVNVRSNEEFASLSDDINSTVDTLKHYIAEASARIDKELEFAKSIQASALPNTFPAFPKRKDFDIFASMDPAKEVGGDFYDFYMTGENTLHFLVADVSGKGIPAAMFMMRAKAELKQRTELGMELGEVFTQSNASLCEGNDAGMFVTAWEGSIDLSSGLVKFANAGHNPPLIRRNGKFEYLKSRVGFVLAGMDGVHYKLQEFQLQPGDAVFLYTDGVTEATNLDKELFGEERLLAAINSREFADMKEMCTFLKAEVDAFVGEAPQFDDITMVAMHYIGTPPVPTITVENAVTDDVTRVTEFVEAELEKLECPMKSIFQINVAIDEIFSNIVKYGYAGTTGTVSVSVVEKDDPHMVFIRFCDYGIPYNPLTAETPDLTLSAEERGVGGLGIHIVRKTMDDVRYKYENGQNVFTIGKRLP